MTGKRAAGGSIGRPRKLRLAVLHACASTGKLQILLLFLLQQLVVGGLAPRLRGASCVAQNNCLPVSGLPKDVARVIITLVGNRAAKYFGSSVSMTRKSGFSLLAQEGPISAV
jgi:hypothetical protein